jgi:hypothetical protein
MRAIFDSVSDGTCSLPGYQQRGVLERDGFYMLASRAGVEPVPRDQ